ncbi:MAG: thiamine diphosphokinase, partial [Anaerolineales bacterium]|nr:thiamine diphosphokinase [Anaerolineales bacterium]
LSTSFYTLLRREEGFLLRAILFANGVFNPSPLIDQWLAQAQLRIAADGGLRHCQRLNILPNILVGDFDSLTEEEVQRMQNQGVQVERFPARKDETDLELALQIADQHGVDQIVILGGLGARWDQTFANLLLPVSQRFRHIPMVLLDGEYELHFLNAPPTKQIQIMGKVGDTLSLIPLIGDAKGVTAQGLEYALHGEDLIFGMTRGLSNVLVKDKARIELQQGSLLVVVIHQSV